MIAGTQIFGLVADGGGGAASRTAAVRAVIRYRAIDRNLMVNLP
jgi:hypothetical protein